MGPGYFFLHSKGYETAFDFFLDLHCTWMVYLCSDFCQVGCGNYAQRMVDFSHAALRGNSNVITGVDGTH